MLAKPFYLNDTCFADYDRTAHRDVAMLERCPFPERYLGRSTQMCCTSVLTRGVACSSDGWGEDLTVGQAKARMKERELAAQSLLPALETARFRQPTGWPTLSSPLGCSHMVLVESFQLNPALVDYGHAMPFCLRQDCPRASFHG